MPVNSYAKINLYLKIGKKLSSGYHNISSVMQRIDLADNMHIDPIEDDRILIQSTNNELSNESNLAYKAAMLLKKKYKVKQGVKIYIEKAIPLEAGLGGGSSNAATTILTLNKMWGLRMKEKEMVDVAMQLGSDVPFFVGENAALVEGIGEKLKWIKKSFSINIVMINPGFRVSTKWAYSAFDKEKPKQKSKADVNSLIRAIEKKDIKEIANNLYNDFEPIVTKKYKVLQDIKTNLMRNDALNACVSGSGPTVFGIYNSIYEAREAFFKLQYDYPFVFLTKTI